MAGTLQRLAMCRHLLVAVVSTILVATSPWVAMLGRLPRQAGQHDYAHIVLGWLAGVTDLAYFADDCPRTGRWRLHFPWVAGRLEGIVADMWTAPWTAVSG